MAAIETLHKNSASAKDCDLLIKQIKDDTVKVEALILTGKLRSAYLVAVKNKRYDDVRRIASIAASEGQEAVKVICEKWLNQGS